MEKRKGSALLMIVIVSAVMMTILGTSLAKMHQANFSALAKSRNIYQAQLYAMDEASLLRITDYDDIHSGVQPIRDGFRSQLNVVEEELEPGVSMIKRVRIQVFYQENTTPYATFNLQVTKRL